MARYFLLMISFYFGTAWSLTPEQIDHFAEETLRTWEIPGLALVVIQKDKEPYIQGYGVRERRTNKLVDTQTLFQINSLTKAFTAITVDMLAKEGSINWDCPISVYFPDFHSKNPQVTEQLSLRDLLCHRSGFPGHLHEGWRLFLNTNRSFTDLMQRLAFIDLSFPFRSCFNYDNIGYIIAGETVATVSGISWGDFCHQRIFAPLSMDRTGISHSAFLANENVALPHIYQTTEPISGYNCEQDGIEAASGINSCADDMALWLSYCLTHYSDLEEVLKPQIIVNAKDFIHETKLPIFEMIAHGQSQLHYALGWWLYNLENTTIYRHTGSSSGMQSVLAIAPEKGIGVAILSNQSNTPAVSALMNQLLDDLLNRPETNWQQQGLKAFFETQENEKKWFEKCLLTRQEDISPSLPLEQYIGTYTHLGYGSILIQQNDQRLDIEFTFSNEKGVLKHWEGDLFEMTNIPSGSLKPFLCEFLVTQEGKKSIGLKINDMGIFERNF
jgi:CubicO group peptidase (beta-lactamase class C family)